MADSSLMPAIIGVAGTTVGAILGFGGGLITQLALERKKQEAENKKVRRDKLQELVSATYEHNHWFVILERIKLRGSLESLSLSAFGKLQAITLYFPDLDKALDDLGRLSYEFENWLADEARDPSKLKQLKEAYREGLRSFCVVQETLHTANFTKVGD